jgi:hypothetical protein
LFFDPPQRTKLPPVFAQWKQQLEPNNLSGVDDWLICSENFYGVIDVKGNKDLVGPVVLSDALAGHWTAYTFHLTKRDE